MPTTAGDILERISEIIFNASLLKALRQITRLRELTHVLPLVGAHSAGRAAAALVLRLRRLRLHRVDGGTTLARFGAGTKTRTNTSPPSLKTLFDRGQQTADV